LGAIDAKRVKAISTIVSIDEQFSIALCERTVLQQRLVIS
jgi:hypothetical protein